MWQKFTPEARRAVLAAQNEATDDGCFVVLPAHLLLGALDCSAVPPEIPAKNDDDETETAAARVVSSLDVEPQLLRLAVQSRLSGVAKKRDKDVPKLSPESRRVLEFAAEEARRLQSPHVGTEHLLLGLAVRARWAKGRIAVLLAFKNAGILSENVMRVLVRRTSCEKILVAEVFAEFGLDLASLRIAAGAQNGETLATKWTSEVQRAITHAQNEARAIGAGRIGTEHLWLGILAAPNAAREKLETTEIDIAILAKHLRESLRSDNETAGAKARYSPEAQRAWKNAEAISRAKHFRFIGADHLLMALAGLGEKPNALKRAQKTVAGENASRADAAIARALHEQNLANDYLRVHLGEGVRSNSTVLGTDVVSRVTQIIAEELRVPIEEINAETDLFKGTHSHLVALDIFGRCAREFKIAFSPEDAKSCRTASELANLVVAKVLGNKTLPPKQIRPVVNVPLRYSFGAFCLPFVILGLVAIFNGGIYDDGFMYFGWYGSIIGVAFLFACTRTSVLKWRVATGVYIFTFVLLYRFLYFFLN